MVRDIRYIFKKVLIGLLIAIGIMFIKSKGVFAITYIEGASANIYLQTQYCEEGETITDTFGNTSFTGNRFTCTKGPSYKFAQFLNSDNNISVPSLFNEKQLINNFTFEINFEDTQTITSTNRYIVLRIPWLSSNISQQSLALWESYFTLNGIKNSNIINYSPSVSTYFFQAQYCNYFDGSNLHSCNVNLTKDSTNNRYIYYIDIPVGSNVNSITLFFGNNNIQSTYDLYTEVMRNDFRAMTPTIHALYNCTSTSTNETCYKNSFSNYQSYASNNFNVYGSHFFSGAGLIYYRYTPNNSTFTPSNRTDNLFFDSSVPNTPIIYNYSSYSQQLVDYYNNLVTNIEVEMNPNEEEEDVPEWLENTFGDFNGTYANNFTSLFSSLFAYPISKMNQQLTFDLANYNTWTQQKVIDSKVCWGTDNILGDVMPNYKVHFFRDYTFNLPCPHNDIYRHLGYGNYGFYPPNFQDSVEPGYTYSFATLWLTIQHGILVYLLFVNCLNIYKYILDSNKSDVEVLEL